VAHQTRPYTPRRFLGDWRARVLHVAARRQSDDDAGDGRCGTIRWSQTPRFVVPACINIVVAANAGGAFSPFGDITTLMVWQRGKVEFAEFFALFSLRC
jgi:hypothetical protein